MIIGGGLGFWQVGVVVAETGSYTMGILLIVGAAAVTGLIMLLLARELNY